MMRAGWMLFLGLVLAFAAPSFAESEWQQYGSPGSEDPYGGGTEPDYAAIMNQAMSSSTDMMGNTMKAVVKAMADPEVAQHMAVFTRNYYEALLAQGFSPEEAMDIITSTRLPLGG